jgi:hypothetical protein
MSLKDVIEAKVRTMPFEAAKDLLIEEKANVAHLEKQVRDASARGAAINSSEIFKASDALKRKKVTIGALQKRLNELRRQHHGKAHISLERAFMTAAKRRLQPETYTTILEEAKAMVEDDRDANDRDGQQVT